MSGLGNIANAVQQHNSGVTGDRTSPGTRVRNAPNEMLKVGTGVAESFGKTKEAWAGINAPVNPDSPNARPPTNTEKTARVMRAAQQTIGAVLGALGAPKDMLNVGFANLTAPIAAMFPSLPAATLTSMYIGTPHCHPTHPPSGPPPIPPTPLPSIGVVMLSTSVKVLINGMPAARADDIGLAPTCCGLPPAWFKIKTGSSNVFIGGSRAARMTDICQACKNIPEPPKIPAGKVMAAVGSAARGAAKAMDYAGKAAGALGIAADVAEAAAETGAMATAKAMSAATNAAQMAADAAKAAVEATMWKDPTLPPTGSIGAIIDPSHATVLIGGFPMIDIPDPVTAILNKLSRYVPKAAASGGKPAGSC